MMNDPSTTSQVLTLLEGTWRGEGRGEFPTVTSFDYRETLIFTRRNEKILAYEQRTQKRYDGQTEYIESHWENGFLRVLENGDLELVNTQSSGRGEALTGQIETFEPLIRIHFVSKAFMNDTRMLSSARTFELQGDSLRYEMEMQTTKVNQSTHHVNVTLQHIK